MMNEHPQFDEDLDLFALGALDAEERQAVESHIKGCSACAQRLAEAQGRIAMLALTVPPQDPPARVKQNLMARIQAQPGRVPSAKHTSRLTAFWRTPATAWTLAAVSAAIALVFAITSYRLDRTVHEHQTEEQSQQAVVARANAVLDLLTAKDAQDIRLTALPGKPQPAATVLYHPDRGLLFYAQNLPSLAVDRVYQLWLVPPQGDPISAGIFEPDRKGNASIVLPTLPKGIQAKAFAVTIEPEGGVPKPTGPKVLVGVS
jgi:anti-sigma-K factor RskA